MIPEELLKQTTLLDTQVRSYEIGAEQAHNTLRTIRSWGTIVRRGDPQNEERLKIIAHFRRSIIEILGKLDAFKEQLMNFRMQHICSRSISGKNCTAVNELIYNISKFFTRVSCVEVSLQLFCHESQNMVCSSGQGFEGSFFSRSRRHTVPDHFPHKPEEKGRSYSTGSVPKPC